MPVLWQFNLLLPEDTNPDIYNAFLAPWHKHQLSYPLLYCGVAFQCASVHKCPWIALICITNNILLIAGRFACCIPLEPGGKTCLPLPRKPDTFIFNNLLGSKLFNASQPTCIRLFPCTVYFFRINIPAISESDWLS